LQPLEVKPGRKMCYSSLEKNSHVSSSPRDSLKNQQLFTLQKKAVPYKIASENVVPPRALWLQGSWIWLLFCLLQRLSFLRTMFGNWNSLHS